MRIWTALSFLAALVLCGPDQAQAQGQWQAFDNAKTGDKGAVVCPIEDRETANYFCYMVGCRSQNPIKHRIFFHGGVLPAQLQASVMVDGKEVGQLAFRQTAETDFEDYDAQFDLKKHGALLQALKQGNRGELILSDKETGVVVNRTPMSLRGSSKALDHARAQCRLPPPPAVEDPLAEAVAQVEKDCKMIEGSVSVENSAVIEEDFDRDGLIDRIIDWNQIRCDKAASLFCGSAGCPMGFFRQQPEGGYVRVGGGHMYGYKVTVQPIVTLNLHGSACGKIGAAACSKSFTIENNDFVPLN